MPLSEDFAYIVETYGEPRDAVPADDVAAWRGRLPDELLDFWEEKGLGIVAKGRFQFVNPDDFRSIVEQVFAGDTEFTADEVLVYGYTAFGTLWAWSGRSHLVRIDPIFAKVDTTTLEAIDIEAGRTIGVELSTIEGSAELDDETGKPLFDRALKTLGELEPGEMYGLRLAPALGGEVRLENLRRYRALEQLAILAQASDFQLVDYSTFPSTPIRAIGG